MNPTPASRVDHSVLTLPGNDPLATLLLKSGLLSDNGVRCLSWPFIFSSVYFILSNLILPLLLGRFSSSKGYLGPFNPLLLPYRLADILIVPVLVYYYGRITCWIDKARSSSSSSLFQELVEQNISGPDEGRHIPATIENEQQKYKWWVNTIWVTPIALGIALALTDFTSLSYTAPFAPHLFVNSDPVVLFFNAGLWLLLSYMVAMSLLQLVLLNGWLLSFARRCQHGQVVSHRDSHSSDRRRGISPLITTASLAARLLFAVLLLLLCVSWGKRNLGLFVPLIPEWIWYLCVGILLLITVLPPLYWSQHLQRKHTVLARRSETPGGSEILTDPAQKVRVREPLYQFCAQTRYGWLFAVVATWILGSLMWQIIYLAERTTPGYLIPGTHGPNDFLSALAGDFFALPAINGLIVLFYQQVSKLELGVGDSSATSPLVIGGSKQSGLALLIATLLAGATFISWTLDQRISWTLPRLNELNVAGLYHEFFITVQVYFLVNFALSAVRVFWHIAQTLREGVLAAEMLRKRVQVSLRLIRIFGGIGLVGDFFVFVLFLDVLHNLISLPSSKGTALFAVLPLAVISALCLGVYKKVLSLFWQDFWAPLLLLLAIGLGLYLFVAFP